LRQGLVTDLIYVVFNGYFLALLVAPFASRITPSVDSVLVPVLGKTHVASWPMWGQFILAFFLVDFIQWGIHRLLNHPTMHIWHHDMDLHGRYGCNFGINLSLWDWIFGTAYSPENEEQPMTLGFQGLSNFPKEFVSQQVLPFTRRRWY